MDRYPEVERRSWLINEEAAKWSILAELGRIRDRRGEEAFWSALEWVLEHRPRVKDAVLELRRYRTGEDVAPRSAWALHRELTRTINDYLGLHPKTTSEQIEVALELTLGRTTSPGQPSEGAG